MTKLRKYCYWPNIFTNIQQYIHSYITYICYNSVLLNILLYSVQSLVSFLLFEMDFIDSLAYISRNNHYILYIMDYFSWYLWTYSIEDPDAIFIIFCLSFLFRYISISEAFYMNQESYFDNDPLHEFLQKHQMVIARSPSEASKSIEMIEKDNDLL